MRIRLPGRFWAWPGELRRRGTLGINCRNACCVFTQNPRSRYRSVDDKLRTKELCQARGICVPETFAVVERYGDVRRLLDLIGGRQQFVVKPAAGAAGRGIVVVLEHNGTAFLTTTGARSTLADLRYHLFSILSGLYSLGGQPDRAIVEQRILPLPALQHVAVGGTPDTRIVLYRGVPVMAMMRLPTWASRGRANLHQGAVGAAIDLRTGRTLGGVYRSRAASAHPDTGQPIGGLQLPCWNSTLLAAMSLADALGLGYLGVDFVLDANLGPVVLEANARPGLTIQVANGRGLVPRLRLVDGRNPEGLAPEGRMALVEELADLP